MDNLRDVSRKLEHEANLRGKTRVQCPVCKGSGESQAGYDDSDGSGSFWVPGQKCSCGFGQIERPCTVQAHVAALDREIVKLQQRKREAKARARSGAVEPDDED